MLELCNASRNLRVSSEHRPCSDYEADAILPLVLLVCKQIRAEALPIYYLENKFTMFLVGWNSSPLLTWRKKGEALLSLGCEDVELGVFLIMKGQPHWENILQWLKRCHSNELEDGFGKPSGILNGDYAQMGRNLQQTCRSH
jgi:hypothetical protein